MANLENALQELRTERQQAQLHVEKLGQAISVIKSLKRFGSISEDKPTEKNNIRGFAAENDASSKGEMGDGW